MGSLLDLLEGNNRMFENHYSLTLQVSLLRKFSEAIGIMHSKGFAHLDIKPDNVLLDIDENGELIPIVSDFGISRLYDLQMNKVKSFQLNQVKGLTYRYASPEMLRNSVQNLSMLTKCDVYSTSILMFEVINRRRAWYSTN